MPKYLSGRVRRTPQNRLTDDRYQYLGLDQAEPNIGDPPTPTGTPNIPPGQQYQVVQCIGVLVFVALSYFIRHFRMLMLVYSIPIVLYMLLWL